MDQSFIVLMLMLVAVLLVGTPIAVVVVYVRSLRIRPLERRLERIERLLEKLPDVLPPTQRPESSPFAAAPSPAKTLAAERDAATPSPVLAVEVSERLGTAAAWEGIIGQRALGWVAVVVLLFATGFFLRYAFQNQWIGPIGRVSLGVVAGAALVCGGRYYQRRGWRIFSQMLSAGGIVLLYLATYGAFGFYHLIGQRQAGAIPALLMAESALLAMRYEAPAIGLMAVVGGLLTPVLMYSERDQYAALFLYLAVFDAGVVWLLSRRSWPVIGLAALLGTQFLFWTWYNENYHPEKLAWALGFQAVVYLLFLGHSLAICAARQRSSVEDVVRMPIAAALSFAAAYVLLENDYRDWLGTLAVSLAAVYALAARWLLARHDDGRTLLVSLGIASGFLAMAIPLQADAAWVAMGWAAEAAVLWWFGVRVQAAPLRAMAATVAALAVGRILFVDTTWPARLAFTPIFNRYATPSLMAVASLGCGMLASRRWLARLGQPERGLTLATAIGCLLLVWFVVSFDIMGYFQALADARPSERDWRWLGQTWLSAWWAVYATTVLAIGFRTRQAWLRWTALGLYGVTVFKVFLIDMAGLDELYRVVAFFVLALVLGTAAWGYQRFQPDRPGNVSS